MSTQKRKKLPFAKKIKKQATKDSDTPYHEENHRGYFPKFNILINQENRKGF